MQKFLVISFALLLTVLTGATQNAESFARNFRLLPRPQQVIILNGAKMSTNSVSAIYLKNLSVLPVLPSELSSLPLTEKKGTGVISLIVDSSLTIPSPEGYNLKIEAGQITITARDERGIFYGLQTLNQLFEDARNQHLDLPACSIIDYPEIACRAVHIDLKLHLDAGHYYYSVIDRLAQAKVNTIIFEFEDKLRYRKASAVGAPNSISIEEFAAISKYAKERNIEISPLVQGLGHASFILKHNEYKSLRDDSTSDYVFDPLNPKTYELQFAMYEDAMEATPYGKYLHIGGDEVGKLGQSELSIKSGMKPLQLQMYWLKKVTDFAIAHHRIPIFWDDMVFKLAGLYKTTYDSTISEQEVNTLWQKNESILNENIALFPKECVYARWNYEAPDIIGNKKAMDWYKAHQLSVMPSTSAQMHFLMIQRDHSNFRAIQQFCQITAQKKIDKILCTTWDDSSPHFETMWRGLYDFASFSWNASDGTEQDAHAAFRHRFFGPEITPDSLEFENLVEDGVTFWETAFLTDGDRENSYDEFHYINCPDMKQPGEWSRQNEERITRAKQIVEIYNNARKRIDKSLLLARRNRYAIEVINQVNEVQIFSARLLILLNKYDLSSSNAQRQRVAIEIKTYLEKFTSIRREFENVYARTRIMDIPNGYVRDSNSRKHWADFSINSDWNFYLELQMIRKVSEWLKASEN